MLLQITVLFTDIVGFTELSSKISPFQLLSMLNDIYSKFDTLVDKYGLYKVEVRFSFLFNSTFLFFILFFFVIFFFTTFFIVFPSYYYF